MNQSAFISVGELLRSEDRILGGFGHAEFDHALGGNLDGFASGGISTHAGFAIHQHELAEAGQREGILRILVGQLSNGRENFAGLLLGDAMFLSDRGLDLGF